MDTESPKRVLVVDDEPGVRAFVDLALTGAGYEVFAAADGAAGLTLLQELPDRRLRAILLDLDMPVLDGAGFASAYRQLPGPHAPIVVISGAANAARRAQAIGAAALLPKPFGVRDLLALLDRLAQP